LAATSFGPRETVRQIHTDLIGRRPAAPSCGLARATFADETSRALVDIKATGVGINYER
jgi:hypothetical protein